MTSQAGHIFFSYSKKEYKVFAYKLADPPEILRPLISRLHGKLNAFPSSLSERIILLQKSPVFIHKLAINCFK